ncbi:MAG: class II fructose-bisphosphate aldolase [Eubacteriaceae bacterium]|jgi:fructose-bisphosphate aldolase class II
MLVTLKDMLADAKKGQYAVGAFNTVNLESLTAVLEAAEELNRPVIVQHAQVHEQVIPLDTIGPVMLAMAEKAAVPVCVHLDHGETFDMCARAIRMGFTSVMFDGSAESFEDNVRHTAEIVKMAHACGVSVEAELGHMFNSTVGAAGAASSAEDYASLDDCYTNPEDAKAFVDQTGVDALAIAFGTTHGVYLKEPHLDLDRVTRIRDITGLPLVMHGGSGVSDDDFRKAIHNGITKVNYFTYMSLAGGEAVRKYISENGDNKLFFHDIALAGKQGMKENVKKAIKVFSCE